MSQLQLFDYKSLDTETRIVVQQRTTEIRGLMRRAAQDIVDIGLKLIEVKERLGHGRFLPWLEHEFQWSERTARNFMQVGERFKTANFADLSFAPSALYLLAAPSTPEGARQEALALAEGGQQVTHAEAQEIIVRHIGGAEGASVTRRNTGPRPRKRDSALDRVLAKAEEASRLLDEQIKERTESATSDERRRTNALIKEAMEAICRAARPYTQLLAVRTIIATSHRLAKQHGVEIEIDD